MELRHQPRVLSTLGPIHAEILVPVIETFVVEIGQVSKFFLKIT